MSRDGVRALAVLLVLVAVGACAPAASDSAGRPAGERVSAASSPASTPSAGDVRMLPRLVDDAAWVTRDGERALVISPSQLLRDSRGTQVYDEAWRRVVAAVPEADTPGMRDQFVCHAAFAASKPVWYLEPARPAVGYWRTVRAGCNPGRVADIG